MQGVPSQRLGTSQNQSNAVRGMDVTALGKEVQGEGVIGLTRSLMYAIAERVALSLWNVDDAATSNLMQLFYQEMLQQGSSPTAALRSAQLKMLQNPQWSNPYYWSAFTMSGRMA